MARHSSTSDSSADDTALPDEGVITDSTELLDYPADEHTEETVVHDDGDYCVAGYAGRAIVGVATDDAVLALFDAEESAVVLPNGKVEPGEDYIAIAERPSRRWPMTSPTPGCSRRTTSRGSTTDGPRYRPTTGDHHSS